MPDSDDAVVPLSACDTPEISSQLHPEGEACTTMCIPNCLFFPEYVYFSPPVASLFSRSRLRLTQGARVYTTAQLWAPAGLRGTCSQRSESRNMASNRGEASRPARAKQTHGNPDCLISFFFFFSPGYRLLPFLKYRSSPQKLGYSSRASIFPFVAATDGVAACLCMSVRVLMSILQQ